MRRQGMRGGPPAPNGGVSGCCAESPGIHSGLVGAGSVRIREWSCAVPTGLLEGWYPTANTITTRRGSRWKGKGAGQKRTFYVERLKRKDQAPSSKECGVSRVRSVAVRL